MPFNTNGMLAKQAMTGKGNNDNIPLNEICLRFKNKYINGYEDANSIRESIKKDGLIEPITVNDINSYLKSADVNQLSKEARSYYEQKVHEGFKYFITTGHRRFYAYCSLAVGRDIHSMEDMDQFYKDIAEVLERNKVAIEEGDYSSINKYASIKAFVVKDSVKEERERYNVANLDQRITKDFEIIDNMIDEMKEDGEWDRVIQTNKEARVVKMSDRTVLDNLKRLGLAGDIKTPQEARKRLMSVKAEDISGYYSDLNQSIARYIKEKRHKNVSVQSVDKTRKILETLDNRLVNYIYSGDLEYRNAIDMLSYYDKIKPSEIDSVCQKIKNKKYDFSKEKAKYLNKPSRRKVPMSEKDWIKLFNQLFDGEITLKDEIKKLEDLDLI